MVDCIQKLKKCLPKVQCFYPVEKKMAKGITREGNNVSKKAGGRRR
jgi:hypothetical protein